MTNDAAENKIEILIYIRILLEAVEIKMDIKFIYSEQKRPQRFSWYKILVGLVVLLFVIFIGSVLFEHFSRPTLAASKISSSASLTNSLAASNAVSSQQSSSKVVSSGQTKPLQQSTDWKLVLVNGTTQLPAQYQSQIIDYDTVKLDKRIVSPYESMKKDAAKAGYSLWISSGYRSEEEQKKLFEDEVQTYLAKGLKRDTAEAQAQQTVARPGHSEHNSGLALDFNALPANFDKTATFSWLEKHSAEYGFILRFPKGKEKLTGVMFEPWHFRYVGTENAKAITSKNMCLEEYVASQSNG